MEYWKYKHRKLFGVSKESKEWVLNHRFKEQVNLIHSGLFFNKYMRNIMVGIDELFTTRGDLYNFDDTFKELIEMNNCRDAKLIRSFCEEVRNKGLELDDINLVYNVSQLIAVIDYHIENYKDVPDESNKTYFMTWNYPEGIIGESPQMMADSILDTDIL